MRGTEAIKAVLTAVVDAETKLYAAGLTPGQLPGARNVTVYSLREAKPGAPDEQVSGYRRRNGTFVAAYQRGPKKHRKKAEQMELAA